MKIPLILLTIILLGSACTSQEKLAYLNNLPETGGEQFFPMDIPEYKIQNRDVLYITAKAMTPDGKIQDFLGTAGNFSTIQMNTAGDGGGTFYGYDVNSDGFINIPAIGAIKVSELNLNEARELIQSSINKVFKNTTVECKLLSFKYTVVGEVKAPASYINYNDYITVLEAIGKAGGLTEMANRDRILIVRNDDNGTKTYRINLQDKAILSSEAYFLLPNDVIIVEPNKQKIINQNLPVISFLVSTITAVLTTTLLMINYLK